MVDILASTISAKGPVDSWSRKDLVDLAELCVGYGKSSLLLGSGMQRDAYVFAPQSDLVIKVSKQTPAMDNMLEWEIWNAVSSNASLNKWLAPCRWISPNGTYLLMARTRPLKKLPSKIPDLFTDTKIENWGLFDGRPVCFDYANTKLGDYIQDQGGKLVKPEWWSVWDV